MLKRTFTSTLIHQIGQTNLLSEVTLMILIWHFLIDHECLEPEAPRRTPPTTPPSRYRPPTTPARRYPPTTPPSRYRPTQPPGSYLFLSLNINNFCKWFVISNIIVHYFFKSNMLINFWNWSFRFTIVVWFILLLSCLWHLSVHLFRSFSVTTTTTTTTTRGNTEQC